MSLTVDRFRALAVRRGITLGALYSAQRRRLSRWCWRPRRRRSRRPHLYRTRGQRHPARVAGTKQARCSTSTTSNCGAGWSITASSTATGSAAPTRRAGPRRKSRRSSRRWPASTSRQIAADARARDAQAREERKRKWERTRAETLPERPRRRDGTSLGRAVGADRRLFARRAHRQPHLSVRARRRPMPTARSSASATPMRRRSRSSRTSRPR